MSSNAYTKNEILKELADKGYFVDAYTLDTFIKAQKIDVLFEDEEGREFYDNSVLDLAFEKLFNRDKQVISPLKSNETPAEPTKQEYPVVDVTPQVTAIVEDNIIHFEELPSAQNEAKPPQENPIKKSSLVLPVLSNDPAVMKLLNKITLSDGSLLTLEVEKALNKNKPQNHALKPEDIATADKMNHNQNEVVGVEAVLAEEEKDEFANFSLNQLSGEESDDIDDLTLLSESFEAQEKFRDYIVNQLTKKNYDMTPKNTEQVSEYSKQMLDDISKSIAKKITKQVSEFCSNDAMFSAQVSELKEKNARLELKNRELEKQNKKLRLLLTESNKNLNSYKPSLFGLYKKENPKK